MNQNTSATDDSDLSNVNIDRITSDSNKESIENCENENNVTISLMQSTPGNIKNVPDNFIECSSKMEMSSVLNSQLTEVSPKLNSTDNNDATINDITNNITNSNNNYSGVDVTTTISDRDNNIIKKLTDVRHQIDTILQMLNMNVTHNVTHPNAMTTNNNNRLVNNVPNTILKSKSSNRRHSISTPTPPPPPLAPPQQSNKQTAGTGTIKKTSSFNNNLFYVSPYAFNRNYIPTSTAQLSIKKPVPVISTNRTTTTAPTTTSTVKRSNNISNTIASTVTPMSRNVVKKFSINNNGTNTTSTTTTTTTTTSSTNNRAASASLSKSVSNSLN